MASKRTNTALNLGAAALVGGGSMGLAATQGAGAVEHPQPQNAGSAQAARDVNPSTLQSCKPYFGLDKAVSNLAQFDVSTTGQVAPMPVMMSNVTPIVTVTDASNVTISCKLDAASLAWTSEADFYSGYLQGLDSLVGPYTYPGANNFYETPAIGYPFTIGGNPFTPVAVTLSFQTTIKNVSITHNPAALEDLEHGNMVWAGLPAATDPAVVASGQRMKDAGGTQGAATMLTDLETLSTCSAGAAAIASFNTNITALSNAAANPASYDCTSNIPNIEAQYVYRSTLIFEKAKDAMIHVVVAGPEATTTTEAATTTTTEAAGLAKTGSSLTVAGGLGAVLVGLGLTLRLRSRRPRQL